MLKKANGESPSKIGIIGFQGSALPLQEVEYFAGSLGKTDMVEVSKDQGILEKHLGQSLKTMYRPGLFVISESRKKTGSTFEKDFMASLEKLNTDYVDMVHFKYIKSAFDLATIKGPGGALEKAVELKDRGLISYIGVSSYDKDILKDLSQTGGIDVLLVDYNPAEADRVDLYRELAKSKILIGLSPMAGRILPGVASMSSFTLDQDFLSHIIYYLKNDTELFFLEGVLRRDISKSYEREDLIEFFKEYGNFCRGCGSCYKCAVDMDIVQMLEINRELKSLVGHPEIIGSYFKAEKKASDCIKCGACEVKCPFGLPVRALHDETVTLIERYKNEHI